MTVADDYDRGRVLFMGLELLVDRGALVPRAETELLGNTAVATLQGLGRRAPVVIDACCGSGNLACGIAVAVPDARVYACDLTDGCIAVARRNVAHTGVGGRVSVHQGDLFAGLQGLGLDGKVDAVVCNPPYISESRLGGELKGLLQHEPREAFAAGPYGLSMHQRLIREALPLLAPGGALLFEFGLGQHRQIELLFARSRQYEGLRFVADGAGQPRVAVAQKPEARGPQSHPS